MKKWLFPLLVLLVVAGGGGYYFYQRAHRPPEVLYKTAAVERRSISSRVTASGTLQARVTVQVGSQVSGRVLSLMADFNSKVKKGDVVAKLDPQLFEASLQQDRANLAAAEANVAKAIATQVDADRQYERAKTQKAEGLAAQVDVDTAQTNAAVAHATVNAVKSQVEQVRAQVHQDQVNISLTVIKSPIDGVVISRNVDVGQTVAASLQAPVLFTIAEDLTKMHIEASVPESDVGKLAVDMPVQFTVDAFPGQRFRGRIEQVRNAAVTVQNVVTYTAIVAVDNPDLKLRPGMTATVTIVTARREDVAAIPNAALRFKPPGAPAASGGHGHAGGPRSGGSASPDGSGHGGWRHRHGESPAGSGSAAPSSAPKGGTAPSGAGSAAPGASAVASAEVPWAGPSDDINQKTAYVLKNNAPVAVKIRVGITDGSFTELLDDTLKEGDEVIVEGPPSEGGSSAPSSPGQGQGQRGQSRMRPMF
ncbi:MAG TPA: efflux RND transporter periplasmic adaptor subunit [Polyangiaceae bacterium]|nr:efflux RND transporter periplasmic adaptor subunit [Polyangiaceae bacterium]